MLKKFDLASFSFGHCFACGKVRNRTALTCIFNPLPVAPADVVGFISFIRLQASPSQIAHRCGLNKKKDAVLTDNELKIFLNNKQ